MKVYWLNRVDGAAMVVKGSREWLLKPPYAPEDRRLPAPQDLADSATASMLFESDLSWPDLRRRLSFRDTVELAALWRNLHRTVRRTAFGPLIGAELVRANLMAWGDQAPENIPWGLAIIRATRRVEAFDDTQITDMLHILGCRESALPSALLRYSPARIENDTVAVCAYVHEVLMPREEYEMADLVLDLLMEINIHTDGKYTEQIDALRTWLDALAQKAGQSMPTMHYRPWQRISKKKYRRYFL